VKAGMIPSCQHDKAAPVETSPSISMRLPTIQATASDGELIAKCNDSKLNRVIDNKSFDEWLA
jgi:hypothetical protein